MLREEVDISASDLEVARGRISELENDNIMLREEVDISASKLAAAQGRIRELEYDNSNLHEMHEETKENLSVLQSSRAVRLMSMLGCNPPQPNKKRRFSEI
jgi:predicted nuclease with TOPRIM domain